VALGSGVALGGLVAVGTLNATVVGVAWSL